jgi:hypothetical protein
MPLLLVQCRLIIERSRSSSVARFERLIVVPCAASPLLVLLPDLSSYCHFSFGAFVPFEVPQGDTDLEHFRIPMLAYGPCRRPSRRSVEGRLAALARAFTALTSARLGHLHSLYSSRRALKFL